MMRILRREGFISYLGKPIAENIPIKVHHYTSKNNYGR